MHLSVRVYAISNMYFKTSPISEFVLDEYFPQNASKFAIFLFIIILLTYNNTLSVFDFVQINFSPALWMTLKTNSR